MKLSLEQVNKIKSVASVNGRKDEIQNIVIKEWFKKPRGVFIGFTSIGKSYCIAKIIAILNKQKPEATTCIIVPTTDLRKDFLETVEKFELKNVDVFVVNSFAMSLVNEGERTYDLFVADELHTLCNDNSRYFSEVIPRLNYKYFFGVSATLEKEHLEYLKKNGLEVFFEIPLEDGYRTDVVPEYCIYNIPVQFTPEEKKTYTKIQEQYLSITSSFSVIDPFNPTNAIRACLGDKKDLIKFQGYETTSKEHATRFAEIMGKEPGVVIYLARTWQTLVTKRRTTLANAKNGLNMLYQLTQKFNEPALIVCGSQKVADFMEKYIKKSKAFHSKTKNNAKNKKDFTDGLLDYLLVVKGLKEGYNKDDLRLLYRLGYDSKPLALTQYLGRTLRPDKNNPNKFSVLVHIYVDDYMVGDKLIKSQQKKWLESALRNRSFVEWVKTIDEIII